MSSPDLRARPSQVTVAGWTVAASSVIVVLAVFQSMGDLQTIDMRDQLTEVLSTGAGKDLGIGVDTAIRIIRWCLYVAGLAAVVTGVLGIYVLQKNHAARIVLSIAAVPIVLTSPVAGSLPGMLVGAGAAMLWTRPARDWFAGRPITPPPSLAERIRRPEPPPAPQLPPPDLSAAPTDLPPPTAAWGARPAHLDFPPPAADARRSPVGTAAVPYVVRLACALTWVFSGLTAVAAGVCLVIAAVAPDTLVDMVTASPSWEAGIDEDRIAPTLAIASVVILLWSLGAVVLAALTWRRNASARRALVISTAVAGVASVLGFPQALLHTVALVLTVRLLASPAARAWFAGHDVPPAPAPGRRKPW